MNQSIEDASRRDFEKYATKEFVPRGAKLTFWESNGKFISYDDVVIQTHWETWQAARQSSQSEPVGIKVTRGSDGRLLLTAPDGKYFDVNEAIGKTFYLAAPQQAIPSGWMPIETAPKDGTEIDVWCFDSENEGYRVTNAWYCNALNKWRSYGDGEMVWANMPSYWMPLPASPTAPIESDK